MRMYRSSHLLVEPFGRGQASVELVDYTRYVKWPALHSCGRLESRVPDGRCCCYCGALLFEQESVVAAGTTERCGKNCCMQGCAFRRGARTFGWLLLWLRRPLSPCAQESLSKAYNPMASLVAGSVARPGRSRSWRMRSDTHGCAQVFTPAQLRALASFTGEPLTDVIQIERASHRAHAGS